MRVCRYKTRLRGLGRVRARALALGQREPTKVGFVMSGPHFNGVACGAVDGRTHCAKRRLWISILANGRRGWRVSARRGVTSRTQERTADLADPCSCFGGG